MNGEDEIRTVAKTLKRLRPDQLRRPYEFTMWSDIVQSLAVDLKAMHVEMRKDRFLLACGVDADENTA